MEVGGIEPTKGNSEKPIKSAREYFYRRYPSHLPLSVTEYR